MSARSIIGNSVISLLTEHAHSFQRSKIVAFAPKGYTRIINGGKEALYLIKFVLLALVEIKPKHIILLSHLMPCATAFTTSLQYNVTTKHSRELIPSHCAAIDRRKMAKFKEIRLQTGSNLQKILASSAPGSSWSVANRRANSGLYYEQQTSHCCVATRYLQWVIFSLI